MRNWPISDWEQTDQHVDYRILLTRVEKCENWTRIREKDIIHCNKLGNILLCGDFNARISYENDFILNDELKFTPIYEDYKTDKNILKTQNRDTKIDKRGKELLDLCISNQ